MTDTAQLDFRTLIAATLRDDASAVSAHLAQGLQADSCGNNSITALMMAARDSRSEIVGLLLAAKANPSMRSAEGKTALNYATDPGILRILLAAGGSYASVLPSAWLKARIDPATIQRRPDTDDSWWDRWTRMLHCVLPGHEVWYIETPGEPEGWSPGWSTGYAVVYQGAIVRTIRMFVV